MEAGQDQLQLAGIGVDVADREDAGHVGLKGAGVDRDQVVLELQAPIGDRAELHGQAEERQHRIALDLRDRVVVELDGGAFELAISTLQLGDLADLEIELAGSHQLTHLLDRMRRAAEFVAAMHQRHALADRVEVQRPVERGVAAADDQDVLAAEVFHLAHGVVHRLAFKGFDARHRRTLRLERAAAGRHDQHGALEHLAAIGGDAETRIADLLNALHHLVQVELRIERLDLLHQALGEALAGDHRDAGNVVDRLLGIQFGALSADLVQDVDQMHLDVEQPEFKHGEQSAGARANNKDIGFNRFAHGLLCAWFVLGGQPCGLRRV